ncbi:MAG: phage tail protein [Bacteroidia bacterium]
MEGTMAVITPVAYNFTPRYWMQCNGQLINISTNSALFSLLGTTYGGNGIQTFALPDLRGRVCVGTGTGAGQTVTLGEVTGFENESLTINNIPSHNHNGAITITPRVGAVADSQSTDGTYPGLANNGYANTPTPATFLQNPNVISSVIGTAGASMPFEILTPYITVNYVICDRVFILRVTDRVNRKKYIQPIKKTKLCS